MIQDRAVLSSYSTLRHPLAPVRLDGFRKVIVTPLSTARLTARLTTLTAMHPLLLRCMCLTFVRHL
jgi:hypothetical protein